MILPSPSLQTDNPNQDWVALDRWRNLAPDPANSLRDGVVTMSRTTLTMTLPRGEWWLLAAARKPLTLSERSQDRQIVASQAQWIPLTTSGSVLRIRANGGPAAVYRIASGSSFLPHGPFATGIAVRESRPWPWITHVAFDRIPGRPALLIFRDRFSAGWHIDGARTLWHGIADGYANAFLIADAKPQISIVYGAQSLFAILAVLSALAYAATIFAIIRLHYA